MRVQGLGLRVLGFGIRVRDWGFGMTIWGPYRVLGGQMQGLRGAWGFRDLGFRAQASAEGKPALSWGVLGFWV